MISVSKKFSPTAATLATTSPGPATGSGISASTRSSGAPKRWQRMAFTGTGPLERCRHAIARTARLKAKGRDSGITFFVCILCRAADGAVHSPSHCRIPQAVRAVCGFPASDCCSRQGGGPMTGMRCATTALILATSLASVAFAQQPQQQPQKPAATQQPQKPAAAPPPQKPAAAPSKPAATAAAPAGDAQPTLLGQYGDWGAYTATPPLAPAPQAPVPAPPRRKPKDTPATGRTRTPPPSPPPPAPAEKVRTGGP